MQRSLEWAVTKKSITMTGLRFNIVFSLYLQYFVSDERYRLLSSIPAGLYIISSFGILALSEILRTTKVSE